MMALVVATWLALRKAPQYMLLSPGVTVEVWETHTSAENRGKKPIIYCIYCAQEQHGLLKASKELMPELVIPM